MLYSLRNNYSFQIALFIIIPLALWMPSFISPPEVYEPYISGPLYNLIYKIFQPYKFLSVIIAFVLVLAQGLFLNALFSNNLLTPKASFLPAVLFVTCFSFFPEFHTVSPILFINLFLLLSLKYLFRAYNTQIAFDSFFSASFYIAINMLLYPPAWVLLLLIPISITIYRLFTRRIWIISLLGVLFPYIIVFFYYWFTDRLGEEWSYLRTNYETISQIGSLIEVSDILFNIATGILLLIALRISFSMNSENIISFKRRTLILVYSSLLMLIVSFSERVFPIDITCLSCLFAFTFTQVLYKKWKPILLYLLFLLLFATIVVNNILN